VKRRSTLASWRDRNPFGDRGPIHVAGVAVSVSIPFHWGLVPVEAEGRIIGSPFPRAPQVVSSRGESAGRVQIDMAQPTDEAPERFKARLDEEVETIRFYVQAQKQQIDGFNAALHAQVVAAVGARRDRIQKHDGLQDILGIPIEAQRGGASVRAREDCQEACPSVATAPRSPDTSPSLELRMKTIRTSCR
jgi:hypothetical protein